MASSPAKTISWTSEEDELLKQGVNLYQDDCKSIKKYMKNTKLVPQIKARIRELDLAEVTMTDEESGTPVKRRQKRFSLAHGRIGTPDFGDDDVENTENDSNRINNNTAFNKIGKAAVKEEKKRNSTAKDKETSEKSQPATPQKQKKQDDGSEAAVTPESELDAASNGPKRQSRRLEQQRARVSTPISAVLTELEQQATKPLPPRVPDDLPKSSTYVKGRVAAISGQVQQPQETVSSKPSTATAKASTVKAAAPAKAKAAVQVEALPPVPMTPSRTAAIKARKVTAMRRTLLQQAVTSAALKTGEAFELGEPIAADPAKKKLFSKADANNAQVPQRSSRGKAANEVHEKAAAPAEPKTTQPKTPARAKPVLGKRSRDRDADSDVEEEEEEQDRPTNSYELRRNVMRSGNCKVTRFASVPNDGPVEVVRKRLRTEPKKNVSSAASDTTNSKDGESEETVAYKSIRLRSTKNDQSVWQQQQPPPLPPPPKQPLAQQRRRRQTTHGSTATSAKSSPWSMSSGNVMEFYFGGSKSTVAPGETGPMYVQQTQQQQQPFKTGKAGKWKIGQTAPTPVKPVKDEPAQKAAAEEEEVVEVEVVKQSATPAKNRGDTGGRKPRSERKKKIEQQQVEEVKQEEEEDNDDFQSFEEKVFVNAESGENEEEEKEEDPQKVLAGADAEEEEVAEASDDDEEEEDGEEEDDDEEGEDDDSEEEDDDEDDEDGDDMDEDFENGWLTGVFFKVGKNLGIF
ncbi:hypothetical protein HK102_008884 [Quaeritorhiza haematococci]|nr:hypothetical protein HK102_008884 [Quaeritorhiza haematococci]